MRADVSGAVDEALALSDSMGMFSRVYHRLADDPVHRSIDVGWRYSEGKVNAFVKGIAQDVARTPHDATVSLQGSEVVFTHAKPGRALKTEQAAAKILKALQQSSSAPVQLGVQAVAPKVTDAKVGTTIVIDKTLNKLYLYQGFKLDRTYSVATAMAPYETPSGTWTIVNKAMNPTWTNPAPDTWGAGLPLTIPPGSRQPAGDAGALPERPGDPYPRHVQLGVRSARTPRTAASA